MSEYIKNLCIKLRHIFYFNRKNTKKYKMSTIAKLFISSIVITSLLSVSKLHLGSKNNNNVL